MASSSFGVRGANVNGNTGYLAWQDYGAYGRNSNGHFGSLGNQNSGAMGEHNNGNIGRLGAVLAGVVGVAGDNSLLAGRFSGDVAIVNGGDLNVAGMLSKGGGSFKIDHPLDPENKYLNHSFVESPDMMNVYNGNVILDANGEAIIELPAYFEALNRDFRYQLTPVGSPGPDLYIASEIENNQFEIAGGKAGLKVSWQVTGIRKDPWAEANRIQVETEKSPEKRGQYLHPEVY